MISRFGLFYSFLCIVGPVVAQASVSPDNAKKVLFQVGQQTFQSSDLTPSELSRLYEMDLARYRFVESLARLRFVTQKTKKYRHLNTEERPFAAEEKWLKKSFDPKKTEVATAFEKLKDDKQLEKLSEAEKKKVIRNYLTQQNRVKELTLATDAAVQQGELKINLNEPQAPTVQFNPSAQLALGNPDAPIHVVEFTDFQCPYCKKFSSVAQEVLRKYGQKLKWDVRHFPLSFHAQARPAAKAVFCASEQGRLSQAKEWIFHAQDKLAEENVFSDMQKQLGLDKDAFESCLKSERASAQIQKDLDEGNRVGVAGTPTVYVNGRKFDGDIQSLAAWDALMTDARRSHSK